MKRFLFTISLAAVLLVACNNSPVDKADALIKKEMSKNLIIPKSYDPIETKIDSAFAPFDDPEFYEQLVKFGIEAQTMQEKMEKYAKEIEETELDMRMAKSKMAIYYSTRAENAFYRNEYQENKAKYEECSKQIEEYTEESNAIIERLKEKMIQLKEILEKEPEFIGYKAFHRYRAKNNDGQILIDENCFFLDKDLSKIINTLDIEEYNEIQYGITLLKEGIKNIGDNLTE